MMNAFGPGTIVVTRKDIANSTPVDIGNAQEFSLDFAGNLKELFGKNQYPIDVARGTVKINSKIKAATLSGLAWNTVFFGASFSSGSMKWSLSEAQSVPASSSYTVTVNNSANFDTDLGVVYAASGLPLKKVASSPAQGEYSVSAGVYTFSSSDASAAVLVNYSYTSTGGQTLSIDQTLLGYSPIFQLDYYTERKNKPLVIRLKQCQGSKIQLASKLEDFVMPELDLGVFADDSGNIGKIYYPEVS